MKRFVSILLCAVMVISLVTFTPAAVKTEASSADAGILFGKFADEYYPRVKQGDDLYYMSKNFTRLAHTYEALVCMPTSTSSSGVLMSNRTEGGASFVAIEVTAVGEVCYVYADSQAIEYKAVFSDVNLFTGKPEHIAVVHDPDSALVHCYINGVLAGTHGFYPELDSEVLAVPMCIGGDHEYQNHPPFNGEVRSVSVFADARTAAEIAKDYSDGVDTNDENLLASYVMTADKAGTDIADESANGNDLIYSNMWLTETEMQGIRAKSDFERAYSFAVIGDTQYTTQFYPDNLAPIYQWIADNKTAHNIQYVIGLGDITNRDTTYEWDNAKAAISILDGKVPYSLVRGNHDLKDYSASANTTYHKDQTGVELDLGASTKGAAFDQYFGVDTASTTDYVDQFINNGENGGVYEAGSVMNTWRILEIASSKWLLLNLDYAPSDDVLAWASGVVESHPDHKVIVSTHGYLDRNGMHITEEGYSGEKGKSGVVVPSGSNNVNYGGNIWDKFVSQHKNIELVLSGHYDSARLVTACRNGKNGNSVTEMLIDGQSYDSRFRGAGLIAMFYFNADGTAFEVEYRSVASESKGLYYRTINQFEVDLTEDGIPYDADEWNLLSNAPSGSGTATDPYIINEAGNLQWMTKNIQKTSGVGSFSGKYFRQTKDIDLGGRSLMPIGTQYTDVNNIYAFGGNYDGCGYSIKNGIISAPSDNAFTKDYGYGLFGAVCGAAVKNIQLDNITVVGRGTVGTVVGIAAGKADSNDNFNLISNCKVTKSCKVVTSLPSGAAVPAEGVGVVGGIVGRAQSTTVQYCTNASAITVGQYFASVGGIVGGAGFNTAVDHCVNTGNISLFEDGISALAAIGGIVGYAANTTVAAGIPGTLRITNCYDKGVHAYTSENSAAYTVAVGGIIGVSGRLVKYTDGYLIDNCYGLGSYSENGAVAGSLAGYGFLADGTPDESTLFIRNSGGVAGVNLVNTDGLKSKDGLYAIELENTSVMENTALAEKTSAIDAEIENYVSANTGDISWSIKDGVLYIGGSGAMADYAEGTAPWYSEKDEITKVVFGDSVTTIGDYAFYGLTNLNEAELSESVVSIGTSAFDGTALLADPDNWKGDALYIGDILLKLKPNAENVYELGLNTAGFADGALSELSGEPIIWFEGSKAEWNGIAVGEGNAILENTQVVYRGEQFNWLFDAKTGTLKIFGSGETPTYNSSSTNTPYYKYKDRITAIEIGEGITVLNNYLAKNFDKVTKVTLPTTLKSIGTACFSGQKITEITLPEGLETIGNYAFENVSTLTKIDIPASLKNLNRYAFDGCTNLATVTGGEGIESAGQNVFRNTAYLAAAESRTDGMLRLGNTILKAFNKDDDTFKINCEIKTVAINAFSGVTVPKVRYCGTESEWNAINIGTGNDNLVNASRTYSSVHWSLDKTSGTLTISGSGNMYNYNPNNEATNKYTPWYDDMLDIKKVVIESGITSIGDRVFRGCTNLKEVEIPYGITSIGTGAFELTGINGKVVIPDSVTSMKNYIFSNSDVKEVVLSAGLTSLGKNVFHNCDSLEKVTFPKSITAVGNSTFNNCTALKDIYYGGCTVDWQNITFGTSNASKDSATIHYAHNINSLASDRQATPADCDNAATYYVKCDTCDFVSDTKTVVVGEKNGHSFNEKDSGQKAEDATCKAPQKNYVQCDNCDAVSTDKTIDIGTVADHKFETYVSDDNATCQKNCTETAKCKWCDEKDTHDIADSKVDHKYENYVSNNDATCQKNGTETGKCKWCEIPNTREMPDSTVEHEYENYVANGDATCQKNETESGTCKWCEAPNTRDIPDSKADHKFENYVANNDATCQKNCTETGKCIWCEAPDTRDIADTKVDHKFENYVSDNNATCQKNCTETAKCKWCDEKDTRDIADSKVDHKFETYVSDNNATCCKDGTKTAKCKWCDEKDTVADANTAKGHGDTTKVFKDVAAGKWYVNAINYNYTHKFISGMKADEFGVNTEVTRGMFITILARIAGVDTSDNKVTTKFTDVESGKYFTAAIKWASENKIVNGMTATTFAPNAPIQRQQLCVMIVNFAKHQKIELTTSEKAIGFKDAAAIGNYAKESVATCQMADIVNGYANGDGFDFKPTNTATRAEAAQILYKFHKDFVA